MYVKDLTKKGYVENSLEHETPTLHAEGLVNPKVLAKKGY
jgi:hypothetical protein